MVTFEIQSEEQAWQLLDDLLEGRIEPEDTPFFDFQNWPLVNIHLPNTPIESSISPTMMEAFIELQKSINRSYTLVSADTGDLRFLTNVEREQLEIRVRVSSGSSGYSADLARAFEKIGLEAVSKMDSGMLAVTILGVTLITGGVVAFRAWMGNKTDQRRMEIEGQEKEKWLDAHKAALEQGTENMRILSLAMERQPLLEDVDAAVETARTQLVKSVGEEGGGRLYDTELDPTLAAEITAQRRRQGEQVRLAGEYRVMRVDTTTPEGFRVTLSDDQREISATMQDALISETHKRAIRNAEWAKRPVYVELTARQLGRRLVDAVVLNATDVPQEAD